MAPDDTDKSQGQDPNPKRSHWTVETLREHMLAVIAGNDVRYGQRFDAAQNATQTAFEAQQTAMQAAFAAQKVAVDAAFAAQKEAVNAALAAADRAVYKAETASEKRFDSVNEFRQTLADQQRTLMPRNEAEIRFSTISEKLDLLAKSLTDKIEANTAAMSALSGQKIGTRDTMGNFFAIGAIVVAIAATLVTSLIAIALHFIK